MSTLFPDLKKLDGPSDLKPKTKTSFVVAQEAAAEAAKAKKAKKKTTTTKSE